MSRKLRFFKDQIHKAGLLPSPRPASQPDLELEELEVSSPILIFVLLLIITSDVGIAFYFDEIFEMNA